MAVPGYTTLRQDRHDKTPSKPKKGGGLVTYVIQGKEMQIQGLPEDSVSTKNLEAQWFQIVMPNSRNIIICNAYRPPAGTVDLAINTLNKINYEQKLTT